MEPLWEYAGKEWEVVCEAEASQLLRQPDSSVLAGA